MKPEIKKQLLEQLYKNELYTKALANVQDKSEQQKIKAVSEDIFLGFLEGLSNMQKFINENPEKLSEVLQNRIHKSKEDADKK